MGQSGALYRSTRPVVGRCPTFWALRAGLRLLATVALTMNPDSKPKIGPWQVVTTIGPAGPFHHHHPPDDTGHQIWIRRLEAPALVLGSTQPDELVRHDLAHADGIEVCRRRSGGGLVFIDPETDCWVDVIVPRSSPLWDDDVARAFHWLGDLWASVLSGLVDNGVPGTAGFTVSKASTTTALGRVWCFGDVGHGEVSLGGSKIVGLSQRRTRTWCRIQGLVLGSWPGDELLPYVDLDFLNAQNPDRFPDAEALRPGLVSAGFPSGIASPKPAELAERFVAALAEVE